MLWQIFLAFNLAILVFIGFFIFTKKFEFAIVSSAIAGALSIGMIMFLLSGTNFCNTTITGASSYQICESALKNVFPPLVLTSLIIIYAVMGMACFWALIKMSMEFSAYKEDNE